jgi:hypothetical protein
MFLRTKLAIRRTAIARICRFREITKRRPSRNRRPAGTFVAASDWIRGENQGGQMQENRIQQNRAENERRSWTGRRGPLVVAIAVAVFGMLAMLMVDHGPWSRPLVQTAEVASYKTTGEAARAAGASVTPTAPKAAIEPDAPGPKAQPNNPVMP